MNGTQAPEAGYTHFFSPYSKVYFRENCVWHSVLVLANKQAGASETR